MPAGDGWASMARRGGRGVGGGTANPLQLPGLVLAQDELEEDGALIGVRVFAFLLLVVIGCVGAGLLVSVSDGGSELGTEAGLW